MWNFSRYRNAWFSDLNYADDVMLFAERQEILVSALQSMEEESSKFGLHILWAETKMQLSYKKNSPRRSPLPRDAGRPKFNQLETVTTFTYRPSLVKIDVRNFELS